MKWKPNRNREDDTTLCVCGHVEGAHAVRCQEVGCGCEEWIRTDVATARALLHLVDNLAALAQQLSEIKLILGLHTGAIRPKDGGARIVTLQ